MIAEIIEDRREYTRAPDVRISTPFGTLLLSPEIPERVYVQGELVILLGQEVREAKVLVWGMAHYSPEGWNCKNVLFEIPASTGEHDRIMREIATQLTLYAVETLLKEQPDIFRTLRRGLAHQEVRRLAAVVAELKETLFAYEQKHASAVHALQALDAG